MSNMTIICYALHLTGPMHERQLTTLLLIVQARRLCIEEGEGSVPWEAVGTPFGAGWVVGPIRIHTTQTSLISPCPHPSCSTLPQVVCNTFALFIRYQLAGFFYDVVK